jgi:ketosteroid isomerase-like protein
MYAAIVRNIVRKGFRALSKGDYESVLRQFDDRVQFAFSGDSVLGGERVGIAEARAWFQLLYSLFPGIQFTTHQIVVQGWPWQTLVATRFSLTVRGLDDQVYENEGMQFLRLSWGRVLEDRLYEDTEKLAHELQHRLNREKTGQAQIPQV